MKNLRLLLGLLLVATSLLATTTAPAQAAEGCYPHGYGVKWKITRLNGAPVVTHARTIPLAPGGSWSQSTTLERTGQITASVEYYTEGSVEAGKVIAKASAKVGSRLQAAGSKTLRRSYSSTFSQTNGTKRNRHYVFYRATQKRYGQYRRRTCNYSTYMTEDRFGKWRSWAQLHNGTMACYKDPVGSIQRKVKRLYCP